MPVKAKSIKLEEIKKHFILINGILHLITKNGEFRQAKHTGQGYHKVNYNNSLYKAHRIIFSLYYNIEIDNNLVIDHINGNKSDNRIENLRAITHRENLLNSYKHRSGKYKGIDRLNDKYRVRINYNGKTYTLGYYKDLDQAISKHSQAMNRIKSLESNKV